MTFTVDVPTFVRTFERAREEINRLRRQCGATKTHRPHRSRKVTCIMGRFKPMPRLAPLILLACLPGCGHVTTYYPNGQKEAEEWTFLKHVSIDGFESDGRGGKRIGKGTGQVDDAGVSSVVSGGPKRDDLLKKLDEVTTYGTLAGVIAEATAGGFRVTPVTTIAPPPGMN